jgi:hypothetical protein
MTIETDGSGQSFTTVENVRVTVRHPERDKDWAGTGRYLGSRAHRDGEGGGGLMMGADLPIRSGASDRAILTAVGSLLTLLNEEP